MATPIGLPGSGSGNIKTGKRPVAVPVYKYPPGHVLFNEGDKGRELFILQEGQVSILKGKGAQEVELTQLQKGAIFGEMSLLDGSPRSATVRALSQIRVTQINEPVFINLLKALPVWLSAILKIVASRIRDTNNRIGQPLTPRPVASLCAFFARKYYLAPAELQKKNLAGDYFLLLDEFSFLTQSSREIYQECVRHLDAKGFIKDTVDEKGNKWIKVIDPVLLDFYGSILLAERTGAKLTELQLTQTSMSIIGFLFNNLKNHTNHSESILTYHATELLDALAKQNPKWNEIALQPLMEIKLVRFVNDNQEVQINKDELKRFHTICMHKGDLLATEDAP
jgi:CRP/FNR family transcriptional regulator, cyclic AMP receptor protein